jgi:hypothetical protein
MSAFHQKCGHVQHLNRRPVFAIHVKDEGNSLLLKRTFSSHRVGNFSPRMLASSLHASANLDEIPLLPMDQRVRADETLPQQPLSTAT